MRAAAQANRGRALEDLVERVLAGALGVKFFRIPTGWVPLEGGRKGAFPSRRAPIDFAGVVRGRFVALECKEVSRGRRLPLGPGRLPEGEVRALREVEAAGGAAFVLAAFWEPGVLAVAPFRELDGRFLARGRASASLEELASLGASVPAAEARRLPEILAGLCGAARGPDPACSRCNRASGVV